MDRYEVDFPEDEQKVNSIINKVNILFFNKII